MSCTPNGELFPDPILCGDCWEWESEVMDDGTTGNHRCKKYGEPLRFNGKDFERCSGCLLEAEVRS